MTDAIGRVTKALRPRAGQASPRQTSVSGMIGLGIILLFTVVAIAGPWLAPARSGAVSRDLLLPPSADHLLGTNHVGADVLSELIHGARVSLSVGVVAAGVSLLLGFTVGSVSGYFGGKTDAILMRVAELFQVMPGFLLALVVVAVVGGSIVTIMIVIGLTIWPQMARIVRAQYVAHRVRPYVEAARAVGVGSFFIIRSEIAPNAVQPAVVQATLDVGTAMLLEAALSFLGLGDPDAPSWGTMLNDAQPYLATAWWMSIPPGMAILLLVVSFNMAGDSLNEWLARSDKQRLG